ncbi:MAG: AAA family ATPase [Candidatus ainarchaeum sp.]|nr:AAA family ATPase [Candidatus ainarchaeum sp.]
MKFAVIVGMTGAGKSFATNFFVSKGFEKVYFGGVVLEETRKRGLEINEQNEKTVREDLRKKLGMAAIAVLSEQKINLLIAKKKDIIIEDLMGWSELVFLKQKFPQISTIAVFASPKTRHARMLNRKERPLPEEECIARDKAEIENLEKGGPIAMADYTIINEGTKKEFELQLELVLKKIKN